MNLYTWLFPRCRGNTIGSRRASLPTWNRSREPRPGISARREFGRTWCTTCHRVNPDRATVVSTIPATGGAPTGASRYSVCLPDVQFRERTGNRRGLQHALRGILAAGGNVDTEWTMERTLSAGDDAAGVPVLKELYEQMKDAAVEVDLASLWRRLGVSVAEGTVAFQEDAPLAAVRAAITSTYFH